MITTNDWRIRRLDERNLIIERKTITDTSHRLYKGKSEIQWTVYGYYGNLNLLAKDLLHLHVSKIDEMKLIEQVTALQQTVMECTNQIIQAIKEADYE